MVLVLFNNLTESDKTKAIDRLISESTPRQEFFLMVLLSILMATFGVLIDNSAVIIGSMLIAPILYPILSISLGIVMSNGRLISRSFYTLLKSTAISVIGAIIITWLFGLNTDLGKEFLSRTDPTIIYATIAFISGLAASFALVKPDLSETLPGIAISVSLIPPLAVTGIGIARLDWDVASGAIIMFLINMAGIIFASMIVFSMMNLYIKRNIVKRIITREKREMEREIAKAKKLLKLEDK